MSKENDYHLEVDDTLDVGKEPKPHTDSQAQKFHDDIMKDKKKFLEQFKIN